MATTVTSGPNPITVVSPRHHDKLSQGLWAYFLCKMGVDFEVARGGGRSIRAHRVVLDVFLSPNKLVQQGQELDTSVLELLLQFLYRGEVVVASERLDELLALAKKSDFNILVEAVEEAVRAHNNEAAQWSQSGTEEITAMPEDSDHFIPQPTIQAVGVPSANLQTWPTAELELGNAIPPPTEEQTITVMLESGAANGTDQQSQEWNLVVRKIKVDSGEPSDGTEEQGVEWYLLDQTAASEGPSSMNAAEFVGSYVPDDNHPPSGTVSILNDSFPVYLMPDGTSTAAATPPEVLTIESCPAGQAGTSDNRLCFIGGEWRPMLSKWASGHPPLSAPPAATRPEVVATGRALRCVTVRPTPPRKRCRTVRGPVRPMPKLYRCGLCAVTFCDSQNLESHLAKVHPLDAHPLRYRCHVCDPGAESGFDSLISLTSHVTAMHADLLFQQSLDSDRWKMKTQVDQPSTFEVHNELVQRKMANVVVVPATDAFSHRGNAQYTCNDCTLSFDLPHLRSHFRAVHGLQPGTRLFSCARCRTVFQQQEELTAHEKKEPICNDSLAWIS